MHNRNAVGSPTSASSTALRVSASASPARNDAAAMVVLLRQPTRRPSGLPDQPFSNGRPRTRPGDFGVSLSVIYNLLVQRAAIPAAASDQEYDMQCQLGNFLVVIIATNDRSSGVRSAARSPLGPACRKGI